MTFWKEIITLTRPICMGGGGGMKFATQISPLLNIQLIFFKFIPFSFDELEKLDSAERQNIFFSALDITDKTEQNILSEQRPLAMIFLCLHFWLTKSYESQEPVSAMELNAILTSLAVSQIMNEETSKSLNEKVTNS